MAKEGKTGKITTDFQTHRSSRRNLYLFRFFHHFFIIFFCLIVEEVVEERNGNC